MRHFALDFITITGILLVGFGLMGDLDKGHTYVFCIAVGVLNAIIRWAYARFAHSRNDRGR